MAHSSKNVFGETPNPAHLNFLPGMEGESAGLKGRNMKAQGRAQRRPGLGMQSGEALKGRYKSLAILFMPPFQGWELLSVEPRAALRAALGYIISPLWGCKKSKQSQSASQNSARQRRALPQDYPLTRLTTWKNLFHKAPYDSIVVT
jgi:hypothetical protein